MEKIRGGFRADYTKLNSAQKEAVDTIDGPLLVIAGPGTGKTQLLSLRVANILRLTDSDPGNILCLTFTEAAARNMRERLSQFIGSRASQVAIHTFHSFGVDIISRYPEYFYDQPLLRPIGELANYELLRDIMSHLPHNNPLHLRIGEVLLHLPSTQAAISWLKQAGISPADGQEIVTQNQRFIEFAEPLIKAVFVDSPTRAHLPAYEKLAQQLNHFTSQQPNNRLAQLCVEELQEALMNIAPSGPYVKPITVWRNRWLTQTSTKSWIMSDRKRTDIFRCVLEVYKAFQAELTRQGFYTFEDMILRNVEAIQKNEELRLTLQEQYHYLMVDEYQDTNGAQNQLLELLADNPVNEGRPNLMVVGDDDQAIYRFQGAHMSIMQEFLQRWRAVRRIVLTDNYRFGPVILKAARSVIIQGNDRLENRLPGINKQLKVARQPIPPAQVYRPQAYSESDQYLYIAEEIKRLLTKGTKAKDIAVLAPKHSYLQALVPFLTAASIPVAYERREHVLEQPHIKELVTFARVVLAASQMNWQATEGLLPTLFSADFWQIPPAELWCLSLESHHKKKPWLEVMQQHKKFKRVIEGILAIASQANYVPLETSLDQIIGTSSIPLDKTHTWTSPFRHYYFNEENLTNQPADYLRLLGQLSTLRNAVREYGTEKRQLRLEDFIRFIDAYQQSPLPLLDSSPSSNTSNAVQLLTAYKAKGLEWPVVFVLGCHEGVWGKKARSGNPTFSLPSNLAWIRPARNTEDDHLRLFFVALTRAKQRLYFTCYEHTDTGQKTEPLQWLSNENAAIPPTQVQTPASVLERIKEAELRFIKKEGEMSAQDLRQSLQPVLDKLKLSATHINDFLDITKGGPHHFLFRHLLHFPESPQPSAVFGLAMHHALQTAHLHLSKTGKLPSISNLRDVLTNDILSSALDESDKQRLVDRGKEALGLYMSHQQRSFDKNDKSEYNFSNEGAQLDGVPLSGKIDVIKKEGGEYQIIDYKTGSVFTSWQPKGNNYTQLRAYLYKKQLIFYRLLMNHSTTYKGVHVRSTRLQFIEPAEDGSFPSLDYDVSTQDLEQMGRLIKIIWRRVTTLDFPDTSKYPLTIRGLQEFEASLLKDT